MIFINGKIFIEFPKDLAKLLTSALHSAPYELLNENRVRELKKTLQQGGTPDYDYYWAAFAYLYYAANFAKGFIAAQNFHVFDLNPSLRILDLGCGGGASSAGVVAALLSQSSSRAKIRTITAIDTSQSQLNLYKSTFQPWLYKHQPMAQIETYKTDVVHFMREHDSEWDLIIASYIICELERAKQLEIRGLIEARLHSLTGQMLIIDNHAKTGVPIIETRDGSIQFIKDSDIAMDLSFLLDFHFAILPKYFDPSVKTSMR